MNTEVDMVKRGYSYLLESVNRIGISVDQKIDSILSALDRIESSDPDLAYLPPKLRKQQLEEIANLAGLSIGELLLLNSYIRKADESVNGCENNK